MKNDYGTGENKISIPPTLLFYSLVTITTFDTQQLLTSNPVRVCTWLENQNRNLEQVKFPTC